MCIQRDANMRNLCPSFVGKIIQFLNILSMLTLAFAIQQYLYWSIRESRVFWQHTSMYLLSVHANNFVSFIMIIGQRRWSKLNFGDQQRCLLQHAHKKSTISLKSFIFFCSLCRPLQVVFGVFTMPTRVGRTFICALMLNEPPVSSISQRLPLNNIILVKKCN